MFKDASDKIKSVAINTALKFMKKKDKLSMMFFSTMANNIESIIVLPATHSVGKKIHARMKNAKRIGLTYQGILNGVKISLIRTNVGTPGVANVMEALKEIKPRAVIRLDYAGSLSADMQVGEVFIAANAIPGDGTSIHYINHNKTKYNQIKSKVLNTSEFECPDPVFSWIARNQLSGMVEPDIELLNLIIDATSKFQFQNNKGTIWTTDGLFTETEDKVKYWQSLGAKAVDMETALLYLLGKFYSVPVVAIHGISDNVITQKPFYEGESYDPKIEKGIENCILILEKMLEKIKK